MSEAVGTHTGEIRRICLSLLPIPIYTNEFHIKLCFTSFYIYQINSIKLIPIIHSLWYFIEGSLVFQPTLDELLAHQCSRNISPTFGISSAKSTHKHWAIRASRLSFSFWDRHPRLGWKERDNQRIQRGLEATHLNTFEHKTQVLGKNLRPQFIQAIFHKSALRLWPSHAMNKHGELTTVNAESDGL